MKTRLKIERVSEDGLCAEEWEIGLLSGYAIIEGIVIFDHHVGERPTKRHKMNWKQTRNGFVEWKDLPEDVLEEFKAKIRVEFEACLSTKIGR